MKAHCKYLNTLQSNHIFTLPGINNLVCMSYRHKVYKGKGEARLNIGEN